VTNIFKDDTHTEPNVGMQLDGDLAFMRTKQDNRDRFSTEAPLPGSRKYPMDVVSVVRPRRGHDY
jgi:hypothetical protein